MLIVGKGKVGLNLGVDAIILTVLSHIHSTGWQCQNDQKHNILGCYTHLKSRRSSLVCAVLQASRRFLMVLSMKLILVGLFVCCDA